MNRQSQENIALQNQATDSGLREDNRTTNGLHGFMMRHMGHQDGNQSEMTQKKPIPIIPILLMVMVALHIVAVIFFAKTGSTAFSFNNPLTYGLIGLLAVVVIAKLKHVVSSIRGKGKHPPQEAIDGVSRIQNELNKEP